MDWDEDALLDKVDDVVVEQVAAWLPEMEVLEGRLLVESWWMVKDCRLVLVVFERVFCTTPAFSSFCCGTPVS